MDYVAPIEDILFALEHGAQAHRLPDWDSDQARMVLEQAARFVEAEISRIDVLCDASHPKLVDGRVFLPSFLREAYASYRLQGWPGLAGRAEVGGQGLPPVFWNALSEMLSGACFSFQVLVALAQSGMHVIETAGTPEQKELWLPRVLSGDWLMTMGLSEPQAGSDLGAIKTRAVQGADGTWTLHGTKIWNSGGDQDLTERILHLVLARPEGMPEGPGGLSLFLVASHFQDGRRNAYRVARIEEKMGLHGSPTCESILDGAVGELIGLHGKGLATMFAMINAERLDVAVQGLGLAQVARQRSWDYAAARVQGRLAKGGKPVEINQHADVRRMLMTQDAQLIAARALIYRIGVELSLDSNAPLARFLTPVLKSFCSYMACEAADLAIQVHGGYGYTRDYRVEQIYRDARITPIYEGTNGIQAMMLAGRVIRSDSEAVEAFSAFVAPSAQSSAPMQAALQDWNKAAAAIKVMTEPGLAADSFLRLTALIALGAMWHHLLTALDIAPEPGRLRSAAAFFEHWLLPETTLLVRRIESVSVLDVDSADMTDKDFVS